MALGALAILAGFNLGRCASPVVNPVTEGLKQYPVRQLHSYLSVLAA